MLPGTVEEATYLLLTAMIILGIAIIGWLLNKGFEGVTGKLTNIDRGVDSLRAELFQEREDRIKHYGRLEAKIAEHRAICDERNRSGVHQRP